MTLNSGDVKSPFPVSGDGTVEFEGAAGGPSGDSPDTTPPLFAATSIEMTATITTTSCSTLNTLTEAPSVLSSSDPLASGSMTPEVSLDMLSAQIWETQLGDASKPSYKTTNGLSAASESFFLTRSNAAFTLGLNTGSSGVTAATGRLRATGATGKFGITASGTAGATGATVPHKNGTWSFSKSGMTIAPTVLYKPTVTQESVQSLTVAHSETFTVAGKSSSEHSRSMETDVRPQTSTATKHSHTTLPTEAALASQFSSSTAPSNSAISSVSSSKAPVSFTGVGVKLNSISGQSLSLAVFFLFFFAITH